MPRRFKISHLSLEVGYVYIMTNDFVPGLLKIGRTTRTPEQRAAELSGTGIPGKWMVKHSIFVPNCEHIEKITHNSLRDYRVSDDREFFNIEIQKAIEVIEAHSSSQIGNFLGWPNLDEVKAYIDDELKRIKDEKSQYVEKIRLEHQLWIMKVEQETREKAAQEIKKKEKQKLDEIKGIDWRTANTIKEAKFGWIDLFWIAIALVFLIKSEQNPNLQIFFWFAVASYLFTLWHRNSEKKAAMLERKTHSLGGLPSKKWKIKDSQ